MDSRSDHLGCNAYANIIYRWMRHMVSWVYVCWTKQLMLKACFLDAWGWHMACERRARYHRRCQRPSQQLRSWSHRLWPTRPGNALSTMQTVLVTSSTAIATCIRPIPGAILPTLPDARSKIRQLPVMASLSTTTTAVCMLCCKYL